MTIDRLFSALWVPVTVVLVTAMLIIGIGELLLALAHLKEKWMGIAEPISVAAALIIAVLILAVCTWMAQKNSTNSL